jgi:hypothetical protein
MTPRPQQSSAQLFPSTSRQKPKPLAKVEPKPVAPPFVPKQLTPAQLREAARNVKALQDARAAWRIGDQRDAENPCKHCGGERVEIMTDVTRAETRAQRAQVGDTRLDIAWCVRCLVCRPMEIGNDR